jgi:hypothetical protein
MQPHLLRHLQGQRHDARIIQPKPAGWLALACAIAVFVAAALDAPADQAPVTATVVQATP